MLRRAYATMRKQWPEPEVICSAMELSFADIPHGHVTASDVVHEVVGDFHRLMIYPRKGFMIRQEIPESAMQAYQYLLSHGFGGHLA